MLFKTQQYLHDIFSIYISHISFDYDAGKFKLPRQQVLRSGMYVIQHFSSLDFLVNDKKKQEIQNNSVIHFSKNKNTFTVLKTLDYTNVIKIPTNCLKTTYHILKKQQVIILFKKFHHSKNNLAYTFYMHLQTSHTTSQKQPDY